MPKRAAPKDQRRFLAERLKELDCLYSIAKISNRKGLELDGVIRRMIRVIPGAWQYPAIAGARVELEGAEFRTRRYHPGPWVQQCPIIVQGAPVGAVAVSYAEERPFLREERSLINVIAQRLGEVIERKRSERRLAEYQEKLRSLAAELALSEERERRRIAQALHDRIGQVLALVHIRIGALMEAFPDPKLGRELAAVRELVSESIAETRSLTYDLSPPILYELGFEAALDWLAERMGQQYGVAVEIDADGKGAVLEQQWRAPLFSAVRELLVNVARHSGSTVARVRVRRNGGRIRVSVSDDGVGMEAGTGPKAAPEGFGLFSIRERLGSMGGEVAIASRRGKGTTVTLSVPVVRGERA
ncbi:MAG: sensor histidine kinase [Acidobacteria bacterium]|nr:sensor histidine kinase [Acidobacteriota bacterium]